jgi:hypothetical protein
MLTSLRNMVSSQCEADKNFSQAGNPRENPMPQDLGWRLAEDGCAFVLSEGSEPRTCGAPRCHRSSYCSPHHLLCHIASGSVGETRRLREVEALASAVGGRRGRDGAGPSTRFLERLEQAVRVFSRSGRS